MTHQANIQQIDSNTIQLRGVLNYQTVIALNKTLQSLLASLQAPKIDLIGVQFSDSSGLALLIECLRLATQQNKVIEYLNIPTQMQAMAQVMGLNGILPLSTVMEHHG
jgi:anti-anti-sigma factor